MTLSFYRQQRIRISDVLRRSISTINLKNKLYICICQRGFSFYIHNCRILVYVFFHKIQGPVVRNKWRRYLTSVEIHIKYYKYAVIFYIKQNTF